jgi:phage terminase small subunit
MNAKRQRFVEEYLKDLNAKQAAIRAGYSPKTAEVNGPRLLSFAEVQAAVEVAKAERAKRMQIDADWVIRKLVKNFRRAMQESEVLDRDGKPTGEFRYEGAVANRALELIGKHFGAFPEKVHLTGKDGAPLIPVEHAVSALHHADTAGSATPRNGKVLPQPVALLGASRPD